jgi:hypothetical protein
LTPQLRLDNPIINRLNVRFAPKATEVLRYREMMQWAKGGHLVLFSNAIEIAD